MTIFKKTNHNLTLIISFSVIMVVIFSVMKAFSFTEREYVSDKESMKENKANQEYLLLEIKELSSDEMDALRDNYYEIRHARLDEANEVLIIETRFGGGCQEHEFMVGWNERYIETEPPQVDIHLFHNSNDDRCEALLHQTIHIDLSSLLTPVRVNLYQGRDNQKYQSFEFGY